jgi:hypothetical protein
LSIEEASPGPALHARYPPFAAEKPPPTHVIEQVPGICRPRQPQKTVLYRVWFHYFDRFLAKHESRFEKE